MNADAVARAAIEALNAGRGDRVIALIEPLTRTHPSVPLGWQLLALGRRLEEDTEGALIAIARAAALAPADVKVRAAEATLLAEAGRPAVAAWTRVQQLAPHDPEVVLSLAAALTAEGRADAGDALLEQGLAVEPAWVRGHDQLSTGRWLRGERDGFDRSYARAVPLRPSDLPLRLAWYRALTRVERWDAARAVIADGRRALPGRLEWDAADAYVATETGDDAAAARAFARAAALGDPGTQLAEVRHALRTGALERAEALATALTGGPAAAGAWPYLSTIWRLRGDARAAWLDGDPPFIRAFDLPLAAAELDACAALLRRLHSAAQHPPEQSLRGGTQTDGVLFARVDPELRPVRDAVRAAVRAYVDALPPRNPRHPLLGPPRTALRFAGSWSVRLQRQGFHVGHSHPMGWISSALYVALPPPEALGPPPAGWLSLGEPPHGLHVALPPYARVEPKPGRLVLFPSTLWHATVPFDGGERLTIAFDIAAPLH